MRRQKTFHPRGDRNGIPGIYHVPPKRQKWQKLQQFEPKSGQQKITRFCHSPFSLSCPFRHFTPIFPHLPGVSGQKENVWGVDGADGVGRQRDARVVVGLENPTVMCELLAVHLSQPSNITQYAIHHHGRWHYASPALFLKTTTTIHSRYHHHLYHLIVYLLTSHVL